MSLGAIYATDRELLDNFPKQETSITSLHHLDNDYFAAMASRSLSRWLRQSVLLRKPSNTIFASQIQCIRPQFYLRNAAIRSFALTSRQYKNESNNTTLDSSKARSTVQTDSSQTLPTSDIDLLKSLPPENPDQPSYALVFTCKSCTHRSAHRISKQGYHKGSVLVQCPGCKNRHLIADNLKIFGDKSITLEQILAEKGDLVKKGGLSVEGDLEMWDGKDGEEVKAIG